MQKYRTKTTTDILRGRIKLDESVAKRHRAALKKNKDGSYEVISRVQLKAGTEFEYVGEDSRAFIDALELVKANPEKAKA